MPVTQHVFDVVIIGSGAGGAPIAHTLVNAGKSVLVLDKGPFYRPQNDDSGVLGLPVLGPGARRRQGVYAGGQGAAAVLFLRNRGLQFAALGQLQASDGGVRDDGCKASCVDWYGNARPIFLGDRVLALMGYEIVEGRLQAGGWRFDEPTGAPSAEQIVERRRVSFAPNAAWREGRYWPFN